jgi:hypothetical protein
MQFVFRILKRELASVVLILLSFIPLFFIGSLLDILLTRLYSRVQNEEVALPIISQWVHASIAGYRLLPQEVMACFWLLLVLCFICNILIASDQQQFRIRFIYSFLFIWLLAITTASFFAFACVSPFDLSLARLDEQRAFCNIIHIALLFELMLILIIPVGLLIWRKVRAINAIQIRL